MLREKQEVTRQLQSVEAELTKEKDTWAAREKELKAHADLLTQEVSEKQKRSLRSTVRVRGWHPPYARQAI